MQHVYVGISVCIDEMIGIVVTGEIGAGYECVMHGVRFE